MKYIYLKRVPKVSHRVPKDLLEQSKQYISSFFTAEGVIFNPLTKEEEKKYMPYVISTSPDEREWRKHIDEFWAGFTREVPAEGLKLNIKMKNDEPVNINDWLLWRFIRKHPEVASTKDSIMMTHRFYIHNPEAEKAKRANEIKIKNRARMIVLNLNKKPENIPAILAIAATVPHIRESIDFPTGNIELISDNEKIIILEEFSEKFPAELIKLAKDKYIGTKYKILSWVNSGTVVKEGTTYLFGDIVLGRTLEDAAIFIEDAQNSETRAIIEAKHESFTKA